MTDLITRARKEWLEVHKSPEDAPDGEAWHYTLPCPPEVVAALLEVLAWAKTHACAPYANRDCACCTALGRLDDALEEV